MNSPVATPTKPFTVKGAAAQLGISSSLVYALTAPDLSLKDSSQRRWFFLNLDALLAD